MEERIRSDLAMEQMEANHLSGDGIAVKEERIGNLYFHRLSIREEAAAKRLQKPCGNYLTIEFGRISRIEEATEGAFLSLLSKELRRMAEILCGREINGEFQVFVAGLGNASLTADAVGPLVVKKLSATRHLKLAEPDLYEKLGCASLSCLSVGVLGQTGVETAELLSGVVRAIRPHLVLVVDALAARECDHLFSSLQLSDAGIEPGSGVGNHRTALTKDTLGLPVLSLGIPTVVNSATLVREALSKGGVEESDMILALLSNQKSFFVSPKDSDFLVEQAATLISRAIRRAFTPGL
ncbi:MAG: GPR endopeptidase [Clostridia bacterium]|nr:GPR endopeptidase [Clostridia bacterium]